MGTHYAEFDSTLQTLLADIRTRLLTSTDWARLTSDAILLNTNAGTSASATVLPFVTTGGSGLGLGSVIMIDDGALREYRTITAITGTSITVANLTYAHASGTPIRSGNELYKATTTRGAQMVVDLMDSHVTATSMALNCAIYQTHDGTTGGPKVQRYLYFRHNAGAASHPLHVTLSVGKEHFFLAVEGPRASEPGAPSTVGAHRSYIFLSDLVPYDVGDTIPTVFAGGSGTNANVNSFGQLDHEGAVSKSLSGAGSWSPARLATLEFPKIGFTEGVSYQRQREVDGMFILAPYVVFHNDSGMRGRLSSFFYAGLNMTDTPDAPLPPVGSKIEYQGAWYKLVAVNRSDGNRNVFAQFGAASQGASTSGRSPVVAVPCLP